MQWYTYIIVFVTLDANRYTQCADFFPEKSPGKIRKTQKDSKVFWCSLGICRGRMAPLTLHPMWKKCTRPSAIQACAEPMVPNTCAEEPMVKTNDFDSGERNCNLGYLFPPVVTHREVSWKGGGARLREDLWNPLKIIRWKAPEIISWILDDIWGGGSGNYFQVSAPTDVKYSKGQPPLEIILKIISRGGGRGPLD